MARVEPKNSPDLANGGRMNTFARVCPSFDPLRSCLAHAGPVLAKLGRPRSRAKSENVNRARPKLDPETGQNRAEWTRTRPRHGRIWSEFGQVAAQERETMCSTAEPKMRPTTSRDGGSPASAAHRTHRCWALVPLKALRRLARPPGPPALSSAAEGHCGATPAS